MSSHQQVVIGIDVGTTAVKVAGFGIGGARSEIVTRRVSPKGSSFDQSVEDPAALRNALLDALADCAALLDGAHVLALSLSTAMHAVVGLDANDAPCTPLLTWADGRAAGIVANWVVDGTAADLHARTGVPLHPMAPLAKLAWFAADEPAVTKSVHRWADLKALVVGWLTGTVTTELSSASGWGLVDLATQSWCPDALALASVDEAHLPPIESPTATLPLTRTIADRVGIAASTPVVLGAGDGPLGNVGVGALDPGVVGLSLGTSGALRMVFDHVPAGSDASLFSYSLTEQLWVAGGAVSNGADVTSWVAHALAPDWSELAVGTPGRRSTDRALRADESALDLASAAPPGCDGLAMIPYLLPERAPLWDATLAGAYVGLRRHHTRAHLARAAIEGVCLGMRLVLDRLEALHPVHEVRATGGALAASLWCEVLAATLGRPLVVVSAAEGSALGAAALGLVALGRAATLPEALAQLAEPDATRPAQVAVVPELAAAAEATRAMLPDLAADLVRVAGAYAR